mmetsp:Transcript_22515/g.71431  ORF Transcript_22515/g.71431 Transcript_22515/m.71431 type:complete len:329 (-) Transcript_22515:645-1631(-)
MSSTAREGRHSREACPAGWWAVWICVLWLLLLKPLEARRTRAAGEASPRRSLEPGRCASLLCRRHEPVKHLQQPRYHDRLPGRPVALQLMEQLRAAAGAGGLVGARRVGVHALLLEVADHLTRSAVAGGQGLAPRGGGLDARLRVWVQPGRHLGGRRQPRSARDLARGGAGGLERRLDWVARRGAGLGRARPGLLLLLLLLLRACREGTPELQPAALRCGGPLDERVRLGARRLAPLAPRLDLLRAARRLCGRGEADPPLEVVVRLMRSHLSRDARAVVAAPSRLEAPLRPDKRDAAGGDVGEGARLRRLGRQVEVLRQRGNLLVRPT